MNAARLSAMAVLGVAGILLAGLGTVDTAANTVPTTRAGQESVTVTANQLKPDACNSLYLTAVIRGSGSITGTSASELILGGSGRDTINGGGGDDCILGGGGNDSLNGKGGSDVCIGGPGNNSFNSCAVKL